MNEAQVSQSITQATPQPATKSGPLESLVEPEDAQDLRAAGWALLVTAEDRRAREEALAPLLQRRAAAAGARFHIVEVPTGKTAEEFLEHLEAPTEGVVDPARLPYYLMIAAEPEQIPFTFQRDLDWQYAVGRLCCEGDAGYRAYAEAVVACETAPRRAPGVTLAATVHQDDDSSKTVHDLLIEPLRKALGRRGAAPRRAQVSKALLRALCAAGGPALVYLAAHGLPAGDVAPLGTLRLSDAARSLAEAPLFGVEDAPQDATGLVLFAFTCFGAGSAVGAGAVAPLARRLLSRGALAVVSYLDEALDGLLAGSASAFSPPELRAYQGFVNRLLEGKPVGYALEPLNERAMHLGAKIAFELLDGAPSAGLASSPRAALFRAASKLVLLGDPAVRLAAQRG